MSTTPPIEESNASLLSPVPILVSHLALQILVDSQHSDAVK